MYCKFELDENFSFLNASLCAIKEEFQGGGETIHKARNEIKIIQLLGQRCAIKAFKIPSVINRILYLFGKKSKARKSYEHSIKIEKFTPKAIGYVEFYSLKIMRESYFISEYFPYDFTIREVLLKRDFTDKEAILKAFARFTYELHEAKALHLDYSPGNILIKKEHEQYIFKIVDINRMKFMPLGTQERLKSFSKLWANDEDLRVIATEYARIANIDSDQAIRQSIRYSRALKKRKNFKKWIRREGVID